MTSQSTIAAAVQALDKDKEAVAAAGTEGQKQQEGQLVWRCKIINLNGQVKRPTNPNIQVITREGQTIQGRKTPDRLCVVVRNGNMFYQGLFGLRLPSAVERTAMTARWEPKGQTLVLEAPYHGGNGTVGALTAAAAAADGNDGGLMMGTQIAFHGFMGESFTNKRGFGAGGIHSFYCTLFRATGDSSALYAGTQKDPEQGMMSLFSRGPSEVQWLLNHLDVEDCALPYEFVGTVEKNNEEEEKQPEPKKKKTKKAEKNDEDEKEEEEEEGKNDGHFFFRNPSIKIIHDPEGDSDVPNPYETEDA